MPYKPTEPLSTSTYSLSYPPPRHSTASSVISAQIRQLEQERNPVQQEAPVGKPLMRLGDISESVARAAVRSGPRVEDIVSNASPSPSPSRFRPSSAVPAAASRNTATTRSYIRPLTAVSRKAAVAPISNTRPPTQYQTYMGQGGYHLTRRRSKKRNRSTRRRTPRKHKARRR
jgi:hypothetical protein